MDEPIAEISTAVSALRVAVGMPPKRDETIVEIFDSAAACTPLQRSRSDLLFNRLFKVG